MKSLYESILSSNSSGAIGVISKWWEEFGGKQNIPYNVFPHGKGYVIIMDDFSSQPTQPNVQLEGDAIKKMPKFLTGIFYMQYNNLKDKGKMMYCLLKIRNSDASIDLSNFDYTDSYTKYDLSNCITFEYCSGELLGLPQSDFPYNICLNNCTFSKISFDNNKVDVWSGGPNMPVCLSAYKNCTMRNICVTHYDLAESPYLPQNRDIPVYKLIKNKYILKPYAAHELDSFIEKQKNKCKSIKYYGMNTFDLGFARNDNPNIVKHKDGDYWELVKP